MDLLLETNSQLQRLAIINANQTEHSFDRVINYLKHSQFLRELDLSWSKLNPHSWKKLLVVIKENRQLTSLNIGYNKILED